MSILTMIGAFISAIFVAYGAHKKINHNIKILEAKHKRNSDDIEYDFYKMNTREYQPTSLTSNHNLFRLETDVKLIQIATHQLFLKVNTPIEDEPFQFDLIIEPFDKSLFQKDGFYDFDQGGSVAIYSSGEVSKSPLKGKTNLNILYNQIPEKEASSSLNLKKYKVDTLQNSVQFFGQFEDRQEFNIKLNTKDFRLVIEAPLSSLVGGNFRKVVEN